jgi:hypothetical protein
MGNCCKRQMRNRKTTNWQTAEVLRKTPILKTIPARRRRSWTYEIVTDTIKVRDSRCRYLEPGFQYDFHLKTYGNQLISVHKGVLPRLAFLMQHLPMALCRMIAACFLHV